MGTPGFAAQVLEKILEWDQAEVVAVYTQPDRPCGRGCKVKQSEVKELALSQDLEVRQPLNFKSEQDIADLKGLAPDFILVAAYGLILPKAVLDIPVHACLNTHASLLPKYRGAAPIQRAIMNGDPLTGMTIMRMDTGLDTGDIVLQRALGIDINETAENLHDQLAQMGGRMLVEAMELFVAGTAAFLPQNHELATHAAKLTKEDGRIDWRFTARQVHNLVRGVYPWPGAFFTLQVPGCDDPLRLSIGPGTVGEPFNSPVEPGTVMGLVDEGLAIACADAPYIISMLCPQSKKSMDAKSFYNGYVSRSPELCRCTLDE